MNEGPYRLAAERRDDLGALIHRYRGQPGVLLLGIGAVLLVPAAPVLAMVGHAFRGSDLVGVGAFLAFFAVIETLLVAYAINLVRRGIAVHEHGFRSWMPGQRVRALWSEVDSIRIETPPLELLVHDPVRLELRLRDGRPVVLVNDLPRFAELIGELERLTHDELAKRALEDVEDGKDVSFGTVVVRRAGVVVNGRELPWESHPQFVMRQWTLQLTSLPSSINTTLRLGAVANPAVLVAVADQLLERATVSR